MNDRGPVLVTASDPAALMAVVGRAAGSPLSWIGPDDPRAGDAVVWFASSAPPAEPYALPALRWIHTGWAGVDRWIGRPEWRAGVTLTRTVGDFPERIAAYVMGHLLAETIGVSRAARQQDERRWARWVPESVAGKTMIVVGFGAIGRGVGNAARGLGMRVQGIRRGPLTAEDRAAGVSDASGLDARLPEGDVVVNLLPATPATFHFWNEARFARLKPGSLFVNVSRGSCVDEAALLAALGAGRPGRALLDVFQSEPLAKGHPFWTSAEIRVTPHVAGIGTPEIEGKTFAAQWGRWCRGEPLEHAVDRDRGY